MRKKLNFDFDTNQKVINLIAFIDNFKGKWKLSEQRENPYLKQLKRIATIESIGSSTRIEGSKMSNEEVEKLLDNLQIGQLASRDAQEVAGYYDVFNIILENSGDIALTETGIRGLHNVLLKQSAKDHHHRGKYKQSSNKVVANYTDGTQKVIFNTTTPMQTPMEIQQLLQWFHEEFEKKEIHPLLIIGTFIYEFLSIHPFQDGNGRLSRLLTNLLLIKNDYHFVQYISFERIIEEQKSDYYRVLMRGQQNRYSEKEIINDWIVYFLNCLKIIIENLEFQYENYLKRGLRMNHRRSEVIRFIEKNGPVGISELAESLSQYKRESLKKDLQFLTAQRMILKTGQGRSTAYLAIKK